MPLLLFLLAAVALAIAFVTTSITLGILCLLAALGLAIAGVMNLLASRVGTRSRDESAMIDPLELHRLREQAAARREASQQPATTPGAAAGTTVGARIEPPAP